MAKKGNKFGVFKGVFTPSILTILGVIMYLRLPWIVGEAGLLATIGIILVAHLISVSTGLSVASIATDKRVETGGPYFMISRSLGLPIGGTLGLALFVGLSFSVSLYLIGFSETFLTAMGMENSLQNIRITGIISLLAVTVLTLISTNLALKTQFIILAVIGLSIISIFSGSHEFAPAEPLIDTAKNSLPLITLFAIFFPAVTGFTAGVSMSGDLRDPKKSIPKGTIAAILVGLIIYLGLAIFFSLTVSRNMLKDPTVLYQISLFSPLVIAGIWGATISSAVGSILGAPRILQATAIDRIMPKFFAKGVGKTNEPRNALILTFLIALSGILIGDLNAIARLVSIFFIIIYGFLNLTCAVETIAGSDFRPSLRVPAWVGFFGAFACFVVMVQLDIVAMLGAIVLLGSLFLFLKRKELTLQSGDTWGGIWSSLVKTGLFKLSIKAHADKRNWRPNIILFSGNPNTRPHLIRMARILVGKLGVFTNFELVEQKSDNYLFLKAGEAITSIDNDGKKLFTRRHVCRNIYEGINNISSVYGFTGFEPNTILLGWGKTTKEPEKFINLIQHLHELDFNLCFLNFKANKEPGQRQRIDLWWKEGSANLNFGITLLKFITSDPQWRRAKLRILFVSNNSSISEKAQTVIRQILDDQRMESEIKVIENSLAKKTYNEHILEHGQEADLTILDFELGGKKSETKTFNNLNKLLEVCGTSLIIHAGSLFDPVTFSSFSEEHTSDNKPAQDEPTQSLIELLHYPGKEILANELYSLAVDFEGLHRQKAILPIKEMPTAASKVIMALGNLNEWAINAIEKILKDKEVIIRARNLKKLYSDYLYQAERLIELCEKDLLSDLQNSFEKATTSYLQAAEEHISRVPEKVSVKYDWAEFKSRSDEKFFIRLIKLRKRTVARIFKQQVIRKTPLRRLATLQLVTLRKETNYLAFQKTELACITFLSTFRRNLIENNEIILNSIKLSQDIVSSNLALKEGKEKLADLNLQLKKQFETNIASIAEYLNEELLKGFLAMSNMLGNPSSDILLGSYDKTANKKSHPGNNQDDLHNILENHLKLYLNKIHIEFILHSLKARIRAKLSKHTDDLKIMLENKIINPLSKIKEMAGKIERGDENLESKSFFDELKGQEPFELDVTFERFFKDIQNIINDLPSETEIIQSGFISAIEKGEFIEHPGEVINLQKQTNLFIGRDMANNIRTELNTTEADLNTILKNINDIIRLAVFNLENLAPENKTDDSELQGNQEKNLVEELLVRIDKEIGKAREVFLKSNTILNQTLDASFEPLSSQIFIQSAIKPKADDKVNGHIKEFITNIFKVLKQKLQNQWVKIIYTRSEGLLFVKKLSKLEKERKFNNQAVHELLEKLKPDADISKKIPYYYSNLFAGNSTINKELWVGMKKELREADAAIHRFQQGYGGAMLITGERNSGKSSLSRFVAKKYTVGGKYFAIKSLKEGSIKISDFHAALQQCVGSSLGVDYLLDIQPERQIYVIDDLELWWERTINGYDVIEEICRLISKFGKKHLFIINCRNWSFDFLNRSYGLEKFFLAQIECQPFDARELKEMVMIRHRAGGLKFRYHKKDEDAFSEYEYAQLFNRYFMVSGGNPGFTVIAWIHNIIGFSGKTIKIRLPEKPDLNHLHQLSHDMLMVILQFVLHRRFSVAKLANVLRQDEKYAAQLISNLLRAGLIEEKFIDVYSLNVLLEPFLVEQLQQRNLL